MRRSLRRYFLGILNSLAPIGVRRDSEKGLVLTLVLCFSLVLAVVLAGILEYASASANLVRAQTNNLKTFYAAEAASEKCLARLKLSFASNGVIPTNQAQLDAIIPQMYTSNLYALDAPLSMTYQGGWTSGLLTAGNYAGLNGTVQSVLISARVRPMSGMTTTPVTVRQSLQVQRIPIFQFGIFYQNDLETIPGADMNFFGPVHTNGNLYVGCDSLGRALVFAHYTDSNGNSIAPAITATGQVIHDRKDAPGTDLTGIRGDVAIEQDLDGNGSYSETSMHVSLSPSLWMDSRQSDWATQSQALWGDSILDQAFGVRSLTLPLPTGSQPQAIIERRSASDSAQVQTQKLDYKATIRITDGLVTNQAGTQIQLNYLVNNSTGVKTVYNGNVNSVPIGYTLYQPIKTTNGAFVNWREGTSSNAKLLNSIDIDVKLMMQSPNFPAILSGTNGNGIIIYSSDRRNAGSSPLTSANPNVVRIQNGSLLPVGGLTIASEQPVYIRGNYNTGDSDQTHTATIAASKRPAAVIGDSINILSSSWVPTTNTTSTTLQNAGTTTVNTALMAGNTTTTTGQYNGGVENLMRFTENWSNAALNYTGSITVLFNSRIATGPWVYGGKYYTAPTRNWGFDSNYTNPNYNIPGFPSVYNVTKSAYEMS